MKTSRQIFRFPLHVVINREDKIFVNVNSIKGVDAIKAELKRQFQ